MAIKMRRKALSPYHRYQKTEFPYSSEYQNWKRAVKAGDASAMAYWGRQHSAKFRLLAGAH